MEIYAIIGVTW